MHRVSKLVYRIKGFVLLVGFNAVILSGCSIFKEDDCECPSFGKHSQEPVEIQEEANNKNA